MKKAFFAIIAMALLAAIAYAEETTDVPGTVENMLSIEFHSVTGTDSVTLNLPQYFGRKANFVAAPSNYVNIEIDSNGVATITPKEPSWRGIETVVFAVSEEFLNATEQKKIFVPKFRNLTKITTKDKIALISDAFTQEQYQTIVGNLTSEPVTILSTLSDNALALDLNKELTINFSLEDSTVPAIRFDFHTNAENVTLVNYKEPNNNIFIMLLIAGLAAIIVLGFYIKQMSSGPWKGAMSVKKKSAAPSKLGEYSSESLAKLRRVKKMLGTDKPDKVYKEALLVMNAFISKAFRARSLSAEQLEKRLDSMGLNSSLKSDIISYMSEYREAVYKASEITKNDAETLISFAESILKRM